MGPKTPSSAPESTTHMSVALKSQHWKVTHSYINRMESPTASAPIPKYDLLNAPDEFSEEDTERMNSRREKNRVAAAKCRKKKKERESYLAEESARLRKQNEELLTQIELLQGQKEQLKFVLQSHSLSCELRPVNNHSHLTAAVKGEI
ncbi:cyclic AMP-dependent transcription factor ATF-3-like [Glandiceps talaboti]